MTKSSFSSGNHGLTVTFPRSTQGYMKAGLNKRKFPRRLSIFRSLTWGPYTTLNSNIFLLRINNKAYLIYQHRDYFFFLFFWDTSFSRCPWHFKHLIIWFQEVLWDFKHTLYPTYVFIGITSFVLYFYKLVLSSSLVIWRPFIWRAKRMNVSILCTSWKWKRINDEIDDQNW